ncbi:MAG: isochorismate synthase [Solimonas sp.]
MDVDHGARAGLRMQFLSPRRSIQARGLFERISLPTRGDGGADALQREIEAGLSRARAAGIGHPIVIGAIPFDAAQPCCLTIPLRHETVSRERATHRGETFAPWPRQPGVRRASSVPGEARFKQAVRQAVANFQHSDIRKAVLSRVLEVEFETEPDVAALFARLIEQNPSAYHFRLPLADGAELVGASPELLVRREGARLSSNPLAGSAKRQRDAEQDRRASELLLRSEKDAHEHRFVIDEIRAALAPLCNDLDIPAAPSLLGTRAMWHLSTRIEGTLATPPPSALQLACRLHPTPAVCGWPTRQARKLIDLVEPFERGMFTGAVGWCDADGDGEWVVTIRCGRIHRNRIQLFAGAGIVEGSCPDAEWAETQAKLQTMLQALGIELPADDAACLPLPAVAPPSAVEVRA